MSTVVEPEREAEGDETEEAKSQVTPMMPPPNWLRELDDSAPTLKPPKAITEEDLFWSTPSRYSLLVSLAPPLVLRGTPTSPQLRNNSEEVIRV